MRPNITIKESGDGIEFLKEAIGKLKDAKVYVGIPEADTTRQNTSEITNAALMFIHTNGSEVMRIPKRPVIEPAIQYEPNKRIIVNSLEHAADAVLDGNSVEAERYIRIAGQQGSNAAKRWFTNPANNWPPLSTRPLGKFLASKVSKSLKTKVTPKMSYSEAKQKSGFNQILIVSGELRRSITYVVDY